MALIAEIFPELESLLAPSADGGPAHGFLTLTPEPSSRVLEEIAGMESMAEVQLIKL